MSEPSVPKLYSRLNGCALTWEPEHLVATLSHLHEHRDGRVTAEATFTTSAPGFNPHLLQDTINLTSARSRASMAKELQARYNHVPWDVLLEQLSVKALAYIRQGEPTIEVLSDSPENLAPQFLIEPFLVHHYPTIFFGDRSSGKSLLALILATLALLPWIDNPLGLSVPFSPLVPLYLDWETDKETVAWQLTRLQNGMDLGQLSIQYRRCSSPLAEDMERISQHIATVGAGLLIIDSLGLAAGGELNEAAPALAFWAALRKLNTTSLILAHTAKNIKKGRTVYGNIHFETLARSIWEVVKKQEAGEEDIALALFHRKPPPFSKIHKPLGFKCSFTPSTLTIETQEPRSVGEFLAHMGTQTQIFELLKSGPLTVSEIALELDISEPNTRTAISRLVKVNKILKVGKAYGRAYKEEE